MTMKAIPTEHNGIMFRSRLEARWAIFMDSLDVKYQYEPEGYALDDVWYLPDFWLPKQEIWVEIKGCLPTEEEQRKAALLAEESGRPVYILWGAFPMIRAGMPDMEGEAYYVFYPGECTWDMYQWWCECPACGKIGIRYEGRAARLLCSCVDGDKGRNYSSERLIRAYKAGWNTL